MSPLQFVDLLLAELAEQTTRAERRVGDQNVDRAGLLAAEAPLPDLRIVIPLDDDAWHGFLATGAQVDVTAVAAAADAVSPSDISDIIFTSGTTADPKGVMLTHGNILETIAAFAQMVSPRHQRAVSILPLAHLFEQAPVLFYATSIGAEVVYVRSRNPRVIFEALRELRVTVMVLTPQILELFWNALAREIERRGACDGGRG